MLQINVAYSASKKKEHRCFQSLTKHSTSWVGSAPSGRPVAIRFIRIFAQDDPHRVSDELLYTPVHAVMHKRTDDMAMCIAEGNGEATQRMKRFEDVIATKLMPAPERTRSPVVLDPLESVWRITDRRQIAYILDNAFGRFEKASMHRSSAKCPTSLTPPRRPVIKPVPWCDVPLDQGAAGIKDAILRASIPFPIILKRRVACGTPASHEMAIACDMDGLIAAARDVFDVVEPQLSSGSDSDESATDPAHVGTFRYQALAQHFISNNDGMLFKVYCIGRNVSLQSRKGIRIRDLHIKEGSYFALNMLSKCAIESNSSESTTPSLKKEKEKSSVQPTIELCQAAADALRREVDLSLMGFDIVYDMGCKTYHIVDVNFFPSFKGWNRPETNDLLLQHICDRVFERLDLL